jgi:hypothetical protein
MDAYAGVKRWVSLVAVQSGVETIKWFLATMHEAGPTQIDTISAESDAATPLSRLRCASWPSWIAR